MANKLIPIETKLARYTMLGNGCWQWLGGKDRDGYGVFGHHKGKQLRAHRASYEFHVGRYGVTFQHVSAIALKKHWKHV